MALIDHSRYAFYDRVVTQRVKERTLDDLITDCNKGITNMTKEQLAECQNGIEYASEYIGKAVRVLKR